MKCYICDESVEVVQYAKNMGGVIRPLCFECWWRENRPRKRFECFLDFDPVEHPARLSALKSLNIYDPVPGKSKKLPRHPTLEELEGTWRNLGTGYK